MAWKKYVRAYSLRDRAKKPEVSIWKKGTIAFMKSAEDEFRVADYKYAALYYDEEERKIGIKLMNDRADPKSLMAVTSGSSNTVITAAQFFKQFNIRIDKTQRYSIAEEDDLLVVRLA